MAWLTQNKKGKVAPKTTARRLTSLRRFSAWAGKPDYFADYTAPVPARPQPHPLPEGVDGVFRMIEVAKKPAHRTLVALCGMAGLRIGEALNVKASDFNISQMSLHVQGKGDRGRYVPISDKLWEIILPSVIESQINGNTELVGLQDRFARRVITDLGERAGLKRRVSSHDLRATFATTIYNNTLDIRLVQELLGHSTSKQTEVYTGIQFNKMREAVQL